MASGTPTFTNSNWHEFQPSQIETSLANAAISGTNPNAPGMLLSYRAQREGNEAGYQQSIDQLHNLQMQEFNANNLMARQKLASDTLHQTTDPGQLDQAISMGLIPATAATLGFRTSLKANMDAKNMGEAGSGIGRLAQGNIQIPQTTLGQYIPGAVQGPNPQIESAVINGNSRVAAAGVSANGTNAPRVTINGDDGTTQISGRMQPGETPDAAKARLAPGFVSGMDQRRKAAEDAKAARSGGGGGATSLPPAPTDNPLLNPSLDPNGLGKPQPQSQQQTPSTQQSQQALTQIQATNPQAYADIVAMAHANGNRVKVVPLPNGGVGFKGLQGTYPVASH